ncbi:MAG TPA: biopolymer transporter ExbD [Synechococcales cyanobacterium M55_K2018_004]|nr:biopolymer transporter ExbD [Synechococcales cyanobacterium M55_K2018_004]
MKIKSVASEPEVRIEIVPLIDVIFCILTFFILAAVTLTRQNAINVDLPAASTGVTQMREILVVSVDPVGQIYVEKSPVTEDQLFQVLQDFRLAKPQGIMVLYASRLASYNDVVRVLDILRSVGGDRVALATLDASGKPESTPRFNFDPLRPTNPSNPTEVPLPGLERPTPMLPGLDTPVLPGLSPAPASPLPSP